MPILNIPTPIFYEALNKTTGLSDVSMMVYLPDKSVEGPFILSELLSVLDNEFDGIYYYEYTFTQIGNYLFSIDSTTVNNRNIQKYEILQKSPFLERL